MVYKPIMPKGTMACLPESKYIEPSADDERVPDLDSVFSVFPTNGTLQPSEIADFKVTFAPPIVSILAVCKCPYYLFFK